MISVNTIQREYCKSIQEIEHIPIFWKNENYQTGKPILSSFYLKPVIVLAPHLNFPNILLSCNACVTNNLIAKGWADDPIARYVHGLDSGMFLMQYKYHCPNCNTSCRCHWKFTIIL